MSREEKIELLANLIDRLPEREKKEVLNMIKSVVAKKGEQVYE